MYIYEPDHISGLVVWLKDYPFGRRTLDHRNELGKARKKIEEVWIDRGGNIDSKCCTMACKWLQGEIMYNIGERDISVRSAKQKSIAIVAFSIALIEMSFKFYYHCISYALAM